MFSQAVEGFRVYRQFIVFRVCRQFIGFRVTYIGLQNAHCLDESLCSVQMLFEAFPPG